MKNKLLTFATILACVAIPLGYTFYEPAAQPTPIVTEGYIVGQDAAEVGELVHLSAKGKDVEWTVLPPVADTQVFGENGQNMVVSFRKPGTYTVVAAILDDHGVHINTLEIKVDVDAPIGPDPGDSDDNSGPDGPVVPKPTPDVVVIENPLAKKVANLAKDGNMTPEIAAQLGLIFNRVAEEIDTGKLVTAQGVITRTAGLSRELSLRDYADTMDSIQRILSAKAENGELDSMEQHATVWKSISEGFIIYSKNSESTLAVYNLSILIK